ncbi:MAG: hypothetical protein SFT81_07130 [Candidatus Caenarcaniphilales bacterium]|nr:hypothetical protein [Candidatus Caenarcaniphilales bacterium]
MKKHLLAIISLFFGFMSMTNLSIKAERPQVPIYSQKGTEHFYADLIFKALKYNQFNLAKTYYEMGNEELTTKYDKGQFASYLNQQALEAKLTTRQSENLEKLIKPFLPPAPPPEELGTDQPLNLESQPVKVEMPDQ